MSMDRRLVIDDLWNAALHAREACAVRGPAWCLRELDRMEAAERIRREEILVAYGPLSQGEVIAMLEGGR